MLARHTVPGATAVAGYWRAAGLVVVLILLGLPPAKVAAEPLPLWLIRLPESVSTVFVAETDAAAFHRYSHTSGRIQRVGSYYMSIGENGVGKKRAGDRRTPIGVYFVTEQLDTSRLHEKYGITAYPLDYPNEWDRLAGREGDGIWIHGVDSRGGRRPALDTDGCIALPNAELAALGDGFRNGETPVVVSRRIEAAPDEQRHRIASAVESAIGRWAKSIERGDMHAYLSLYDEEFERWAMDKSRWSALSVRTLGGREISSVEIDDLLILAYPGEDDLILSRFRQTVTEGDRVDDRLKRLYWRRDESGSLKIVAEDAG